MRKAIVISLSLFLAGCEYNPFDSTQNSINETLERVTRSLHNNDCESFLEEFNPAQQTKSFTIDDCRSNFSDRNYIQKWVLITQFAKSSKGTLNNSKNEYTVDIKPLSLHGAPDKIRLIKIQNKWYVTD